jgi:serine/threonine protein kinase
MSVLNPISFRYVENGSLLSTLKAFGAFPERLVASFCIKILSGLEYLHANQVREPTTYIHAFPNPSLTDTVKGCPL